MLSLEEDVEAQVLRDQGWLISAIARHLGRDRKTIRSYLSGERQPGRRKPSGPDPFEPVVAYCRARLTDDPLRRRGSSRRAFRGGRRRPPAVSGSQETTMDTPQAEESLPENAEIHVIVSGDLESGSAPSGRWRSRNWPLGGVAGVRFRDFTVVVREYRFGFAVERVRCDGGGVPAAGSVAGGRATEPRPETAQGRD
ncbi:hypothetical protein [Amycolatopsis sp. NPDC059021]|uniref:hypothetical protein n=1 Tax=Amycolatopsis sp. NPDC059021 TaxID=3346704 RepID=UPI00366CBBCF